MEIITLIIVAVVFLEVTYLLLAQQKKLRQRRVRSVLIDTSVLIDGRILEIARSGFMSDLLLIPRSVVGELQLLADGADSDKRSKARYGLDLITELQALDTIEVQILSDSAEAREGVDNRLLSLAKQYGATLCTVDYNLNKVAQVEGIQVLNVNELARTLRMNYLPGELITLHLTGKGNDNTQAVGHLDDGTMVVVEQAKAKIGQIVKAEVIRNLQTAAGRMVFARLLGQDKSQQQSSQAKKKDTSELMHTANNRVSSSNSLKNPTSSEQKSNAAAKKKKTPAVVGRKPRPVLASSRNSSSSKEALLIELVNKQQD